MSRRGLAHAVDADMAFLDKLRGAGAGFHDPRMPQELVEALPVQISVLAIARELILQRSELGKRRVGIGGAVARGRRGRVVAQRRPALTIALVPSFVSTAVAVTPVAIVAAIALTIAEFL